MLASVKFTGGDLAGLIVAISFAAGLNLYATVASLGLMAHAGWVDLPPGLHLLESWWVIGAAGALFAMSFLPTRFRRSIWCGTRCTRLFACRRQR